MKWFQSGQLLSTLAISFLSSSFTYGQAASDTQCPSQPVSIIAGAMVALVAFIGSQIVIPLYKYFHEQNRSKQLLLIIMKVTADKALDFFGERPNTSTFEGVIFQIEQQIQRVKEDDQYLAHISVSDADTLNTKIMDREQFWLIDKRIIQAYVKFDENASRARFMCQSVSDKDFLQLVTNDRKRYIAALEQIKEQFQVWIESTKMLRDALPRHIRVDLDN